MGKTTGLRERPAARKTSVKTRSRAAKRSNVSPFGLAKRETITNNPFALAKRETITNQSVSEMFSVDGIKFTKPEGYAFSQKSALKAIEAIPRGAASKAGLFARSGVKVGDTGSYAFVQHVEKTGDGLTGDHQPSGAAVNHAIRELLHVSLNKQLTRSMARNAYRKAITVVVTDIWHKKKSRTYGGRNSQAQIRKDSQDLAVASIADWQTTVSGLIAEGLSNKKIVRIFNGMSEARQAFFTTGEAQPSTLGK